MLLGWSVLSFYWPLRSWEGRRADGFCGVDYCLAHLLRGIVLRFIAHPDGHTKPVPAESQIPVREADEQALISYKFVFPSSSLRSFFFTYCAGEVRCEG